MIYVLFIAGYCALAAYLIFQAVMLDKLSKWNKELLREVERLQPPF